jgi:hypothetical protein
MVRIIPDEVSFEPVLRPVLDHPVTRLRRAFIEIKGIARLMGAVTGRCCRVCLDASGHRLMGSSDGGLLAVASIGAIDLEAALDIVGHCAMHLVKGVKGGLRHARKVG